MRMLKLGEVLMLDSCRVCKPPEKPPAETVPECQREGHASNLELRLPTRLESKSQPKQHASCDGIEKTPCSFR